MIELSNEFSAVAASVDITPSELLPLAGYGNRLGPATKIADRLEANAVIIRRNEPFVVFVSCDLLFIGYHLRQRLEELLKDCVPAEYLFTSATHTHFAPATDPAMPRLGQASPEYIETVAAAVASMVRRLVHMDPQAVNLQYKSGSADHAINRRLPVMRPRLGFPPWGLRWEMRPNEDSAIDRRIRVLSIEDDAGRPIAVCWSYACHPVCFPEKMHVSADFPGVVREAIRKRFGNIPVLFWQGFAGDVRPRSIHAPRWKFANRWLLPAFGAFTPEQWRKWSAGLSACVISALEATGRKLTGEISAVRRQLLVSELGLDCQNRDISIHEIKLGSDLELFGMSAELANAYVGRLEAARAGSTVLPMGYIDGVPCYIPTDEMVVQGGYEVAGFMRLFGVSGRFRSNVSALIEREFRRPGNS